MSGKPKGCDVYGCTPESLFRYDQTLYIKSFMTYEAKAYV